MNSILTSTTSCPCCRQSSLEAEISSFLKSNNIDFTPQKHFSWLGLQTLDFYLPKYNIAIELNDRSHKNDYGRTRDLFKQETLTKLKIPVLMLWFKDIYKPGF